MLSSQDVEEGCHCESVLQAGHCDLPCALQGRLMYIGIWTGLYDHLLVITGYRNILSSGEKRFSLWSGEVEFDHLPFVLD